jgi:hypothetical protein
MDMKMIHGLPAVGLAVDNKAGALFAAAQSGGKLLGLEDEPSGKVRVSIFKLHNVPDMPFWNQEEMKGRLGVHIVESQHIAVLIDFFRGYFPGNDFAE